MLHARTSKFYVSSELSLHKSTTYFLSEYCSFLVGNVNVMLLNFIDMKH